MTKKIILIWDFDGAIGQINATFPYNYDPENLLLEQEQVEYALNKLNEFGVKSCFAITGFSAETGSPPFNFPHLIRKIFDHGHEIASHSWKHEWVPLFSREQVFKSFARSKLALENAIEHRQEVVGYVPPHNKPATWIRRGAYSLGDKGLWPLFSMGDLDRVFTVLLQNGYQWMRISHNPLKHKIGIGRRIRTGKVYRYRGLLLLENHYTGFDAGVRSMIENSDREYYIISAHPAMLAKDVNKNESKVHFEAFLKQFANNPNYAFVRPMDLL